MANYKILTYGDANEDVKKLQNSLNEKTGANLAIDGIYGEKTRDAVRGYQQANGLSVDGIAGSETLGHLYGTGVSQAGEAAAPALTDLEKDWQNYLNREVFSYDAEKDPLYQQYRQQYTNLGKLAMEDTVGQVSALTGGYGNSYAQTAGQQTYQGYLQQLSAVMPELYGAAYERYQAEGQALYNEILLQEQRKQDAYSRLTSLMALGYNPTDEELTAAGLTRAHANTLKNYYTPTYTDSSYVEQPPKIATEPQKTYTYDEVKTHLKKLGLSTDALMTQRDWLREKRMAGKNIAGTQFDYPSYQDYLRVCAEELG